MPPAICEALGQNNGQIVRNLICDLVKNSSGEEIGLSENYAELLHDLIKFNVVKIYDSIQAKSYKRQARSTLELLFEELWKVLDATKRFTKNGSDLSKESQLYKAFAQFVLEDMKETYLPNDTNSAIVLDFIAGMTDNFAVGSFQEIFVPKSSV